MFHLNYQYQIFTLNLYNITNYGMSPGRLLPKLLLRSKYKSISPVDKEQVSDQLTMFVGLNRILKGVSQIKILDCNEITKLL